MEISPLVIGTKVGLSPTPLHTWSGGLTRGNSELFNPVENTIQTSTYSPGYKVCPRLN
jgi:hypothetical protein